MTDVSIYHTDDGSYKIFDSLARDKDVRSYPRYMCTIRSTNHRELSAVFPDYYKLSPPQRFKHSLVGTWCIFSYCLFF